MNMLMFDEQQITPSKVVCIGRNYTQHIAELNNQLPEQMVVFIKTNSAITDQLKCSHGESSNRETLHYEGEICFVIKEQCLAGVGFGLDLTKRELQSSLKRQGLPWERAKSFDGAGVFDRFVALPDAVDLSQLSMSLQINGELVQQGGVKDMLFKPQEILDDVMSFLSLKDGDIIMTGTPSGVGAVLPGGQFIGRIFYKQSLLVESHWRVS